jgi:hypothetical protein
VLAERLGQITGIQVIELDRIFWSPELRPMAKDDWTATQTRLVESDSWIMDGDLGPYDVVEPRLQAADTVIVLDISPMRCTLRALIRSTERADFWRWLWTWRRRFRPVLMAAIADHAPRAQVVVLRSPPAVRRLLADLAA